MTISYVNSFINLEIDKGKPWKIEPQVLAHPVYENFVLSVSDTGLPSVLLKATIPRMDSFLHL